MSISVELTAEQEQVLQDVARQLGVSVDTLATAAVRDLLQQATADFSQVAERVLDKNRELYRRLA